MSENRWLTLEEVCAELRLPPNSVWKLVRAGRIVGFTSRNRTNARSWRFLDPSEEYKRALHAQEMILRNQYRVDILEFPIISTPELAEIAGISPSTVRNFVADGTLKPHKIGRQSVYTAVQVREFLLKREHKESVDWRIRCQQLVEWCRRAIENHPGKIMTAEQVKRDDAIEGTLRRIMRQREPMRSKNLAEFWRRWSLVTDSARLAQERSRRTQEPL